MNTIGAVLIMWVSGTPVGDPVAEFASMQQCRDAIEQSEMYDYRNRLTTSGRPFMMCLPIGDLEGR